MIKNLCKLCQPINIKSCDTLCYEIKRKVLQCNIAVLYFGG